MERTAHGLGDAVRSRRAFIVPTPRAGAAERWARHADATEMSERAQDSSARRESIGVRGLFGLLAMLDDVAGREEDSL
jgi:hypothetical protein